MPVSPARTVLSPSEAWRPLKVRLAALSAALWVVPAAIAAPPGEPAPPPSTPPVVQNSTLDGPLFYELLRSELELARGEPGTAYQLLLGAARRTRSEALFQRSVDVAVGARAGEQALAATKAWRSSLPRSRRAAEIQAQLLLALGRPADAAEPLRAMVELAPDADRAETIGQLPRLLGATQTKSVAAGVMDDVLKPWRTQGSVRSAALTATGRAWQLGGEPGRALAGARDALRLDPEYEPAAQLAVDLIDASQPEAETLVRDFLERRPDAGAVRLSYARRLAALHRYPDGLAQVRTLTARPDAPAAAWMLVGALQLEVGQAREAQAALQQYLARLQSGATSAPGSPEADEVAAEDGPSSEMTQAYLLLSQAAEQLKDYAGAQRWLDQLGDMQASPSVVTRRAMLLGRQGRVKEGQALLQTLPEHTPQELRTKVLAQTQLLRDARAWKDARELLLRANERLPDDADLLYEQALVSERLQRFDEMEQLLRKVMTLKPDQQHAYNALGYSFADRNIRLSEARELVTKALALAPGDPFITDSLAWVEFRLGQRERALDLLRQAYERRPDTEIGAHLGEVLWALGRQDEARRIWRAGLDRDAANDVLRETLERLKVRL